MNHSSFPAEHDKAISYKRIDVSSPAFEENGFIPPRHACDGKDVNPPLHFDHITKETSSLAIIVGDPDAPATK